MRCLYCHNPDTWARGIGEQLSAEEIIEDYNKNRSFYKNGGITVTGGEPLLQLDFLIELFGLAKEQGIHTCIDTSGIVYSETNEFIKEKLDRLMKFTDLVLLDIKHIDREKHKRLTSMDNTGILSFLAYLADREIPVCIRHVIVKGYTDDPSDLRRLGRFIGAYKNVKALDVLPYHSMGEGKYRELGLEYPLEGMPALDKADAVRAKEYILDGIKEARRL